MTLNFHKKPQRDFVFHFKKNKFIIPYLFYLFCSLSFFLQHADVHATACWRIGSYAPASIHVINLGRSPIIKKKYINPFIGNLLQFPLIFITLDLVTTFS